jgi:hypothetical protein
METNANFFRRKLSKMAENCDHNIDPWSPWPKSRMKIRPKWRLIKWPPGSSTRPSTPWWSSGNKKIRHWTHSSCERSKLFLTTCHPIPWRDSISRPIAPVYSVAGGDDTTRPRRQGLQAVFTWLEISSIFYLSLSFAKPGVKVFPKVLSTTLHT